MGKVILVHANCVNSHAKGDFIFAAGIAKGLACELHSESADSVDVVLTSTTDGIERFKSIYETVAHEKISVDGVLIGLVSLDNFNAVDHTVIAYIDANRCKHSPAHIIRRVLSPDSKFLIIGNANQYDFTNENQNTVCRQQFSYQQPMLYEHFSSSDVMLASAGLGNQRLGFPEILSKNELNELSDVEKNMIPEGKYGFVYMNYNGNMKDYKLIKQYINLTKQPGYLFVGKAADEGAIIQQLFEIKHVIKKKQDPIPKFFFIKSMPNNVMRHSMANASGRLVVSTGISSTLEAMQDGKLSYYQYMNRNKKFVSSYLFAVNSVISADSSLIGNLPELVFELSNLLFSKKPLNHVQMERSSELLNIEPVSLHLVSANKKIIDNASGKIAPRLLGFINSARETQDAHQLQTVCAALRKQGETQSPVPDQALRRAACWGHLFETKVLIKSMTVDDINKKSPNVLRTALHWAAMAGSLDCARLLIRAGASLDEQDKDMKTALHFAVIKGNIPMIKELLIAGASTSLLDNNNKSAQSYAEGEDILLLFTGHSNQNSEELSETVQAETVREDEMNSCRIS